ncbi:MAG: DUF1643 domain-containing protein [Jatrophihabitans sp.]|uniref:DUF1643 domain-containing protein n=1 Tax=Jatrophihabitans sp. TaxID=1932789 RepID=UPI003F8032E9
MILRPPQVLSDCERYEYAFRRVWDSTKPLALWIMLNPSNITPVSGWTDISADGPTVARCVAFSKGWGCGGMMTGNIFAYRATKPDDLKQCEEPIGPDNDATLQRLLDEASVVIAGWGASFPRVHSARVREVHDMLQARGAHCLGRTAEGHPRHPLYVRGTTPRVPL